MTTTYAANGSVVKPTVGSAFRQAITATSNTTPIQVTATGHPFNTGDTVEQEGLPVIPANGVFQITKIDANTYSLNGTTAPGAPGGAGGYATDYELLPAIKLPAGGELADPGVVGAAFEGVSNPAPFLYRAAGKYRCVQEYGGVIAAGTYPYINNAWSVNNAFTSTTPVSLANAALTFKAISDNPSGVAPTFLSTDLLEITTSFTVIFNPTTTSTTVASYLDIGCGVFSLGSLYSGPFMPFATVKEVHNSVAPDVVPVCLTTIVSLSLTPFSFPVTDLGFALWGAIDLFGATVTSSSVTLVGNWSALIRQLRLN